MDIAAESPRAQAFVEKAQASFAVGDMNATRLYLSFAHAYEKENAQITAALARVGERLAPSL